MKRIREFHVVTRVLVGVGAVGGLCLAGILAAEESTVRVALACALAAGIAFLGLMSPRRLLLALIVWLVALGLVRRTTAGVLPLSVGGDPLLLVGPAIIVTLLLAALITARDTDRWVSPLSVGVLTIAIALTASVFNPQQGGIVVGLAGLVLIVVPILTFWIGRSALDDQGLLRVMQCIALLSIVVAGYGLNQTLRHFPAWDGRWIRETGYAALNVSGFTRPFSTFSSAAEYASFIAIGLVISGLLLLQRRRWLLGLASVSVISASLWLVSVRSIIVLTVTAAAIMLSAWLQWRPSRALLFAALVGLVIPLVVSAIGRPEQDNSAVSALAQHQFEGLSDPFGERSSLTDHISEAVSGVRSAIRAPAGTGVGSVTVAADRFGGNTEGTEADIGNAGASAGIVGLVGYCVVAAAGLAGAYRVAAIRRDMLSSAVLGVLTITFLQWLNGGQYSVAILPWLALGWVDRAMREASASGTSEGGRRARDGASV